VADEEDTYLSLINSTGRIITKSFVLDDEIFLCQAIHQGICCHLSWPM